MENDTLNTVLTRFSKHTDDPTNFLNIDANLVKDLKTDVKNIYDFTKSEEEETKSKFNGKSFKKLLIDKFDLEQLWQQIELKNDDVIDTAVKDVSSLLAAKNNLVFNNLKDQLVPGNESDTDFKPNKVLDDSADESSGLSSDDDLENSKESLANASDSSDESIRENELGKNNKKGTKRKQHGSIVDDEFFKLNEMEAFLESEENPKPKKSKMSQSEDSDEEDNESVDLFEEESNDSEDDAKKARFKDYFVAKEEKTNRKQEKNKLVEESKQEDRDESEPEDLEKLEQELKSTLERRQERLKKKIEELEEEAVSDKPWQLKGEVTAEKRPQNSLLEEIVEFDLTSRPAPIITEQTSLQLEDIIRQRIKNKIFDSVEKKVRPVETPTEYRKQLVLDQEKSKESLANIYEKEYLQQKAALEKSPLDIDEPEPEKHKEIKKLMTELFRKLDALSNYHFTSTPPIPELKIVSNLPAINMEEVAPVATSDAALLAPEEIKKKIKGNLIGKSEKTKTDKKAERRKKKLKQKIHSKHKAKLEEKKASKRHLIKF